MRYIFTTIMAVSLFFASGCAKQPALKDSHQSDHWPEKIKVGDAMPSLRDFRPLPGRVVECNGRAINVKVYMFHGGRAAIAFYLHRHKKPYGISWWSALPDRSDAVFFGDPDEDGIIDRMEKGFVPDRNCLEGPKWKHKVTPGLESAI